MGMALIKRLIAEGHKVTSLSRKEYPLHWAMGINSILADIADAEAVENACKGKDVVFHLAAKTGDWGDYREFYAVNVTGTENVIKGCRTHDVSRIIFTSSSSVVFDGNDLEGIDETYPYPEKQLSYYAETKAIAEKLILEANSDSLRTISLRPHLVWGPYDSQLVPWILRNAASGNLRRIGDKEYFKDTTYIDNMIDALMLAAKALETNPDASGRALFITNGEPARVWDFINSIIQVAGYEPVTKKTPEKLMLISAGISEWFHRVFRLRTEPFMTRYAIRELCSNHWFDISSARELLGYTPRVSYSEGFRQLRSYLRKGRPK